MGTAIPTQAYHALRHLLFLYATENYWGFGLCPSYSILETRKHNVSGIGSVSVLR
jgi:hypothetical protein